ncbi:sn-glycerol-3-phosphate ABC transporter ATP-binding protein UgpC [Agrobacterium vitis]|uniref:ABC transporter ATP-binding protein n=1 Tax=Agrobacterium vitis TaxID=373 RepID=UPI001F3B3CCA|nr:sn-glycerol-3-phosphate ABC transporter ATP-binding protein UgpC [Agrobacterium vitis]MCE6076470.1 sn-glycerol-3-phosphate ABC transporter ATP-binding protein UgpC [Agrobacterium vitis]
MASVDVKGIFKNFGATQVLSDIALAIENGEFLVLVGPSGCGKSTLLRLIAGLDEADAGSVYIDGRDVTDLEPRERDIAMVFQSYALYPHMSVRQNIGFGLKLAGQPAAQINAAVEDAARLLGLSALLDRKPRQLSGGQRQRVAMGRAIVRKPALFLFDEPLSNLDAKLRVQMRTEVRSLHERLGATSIYVTHDQVEAMTMADRIVVLDRGRIMQIGTPLEIYANPANRFVAEFIGAPGINILDGEIAQDGIVRAAGLVLGRSAAIPGPVDIGIRPEDLLAGAVKASDAWSVTFDIVEHLGAETYAFADIDGRRVCWRRSGSQGRAGDRAWLRPDLDRIHLFDKATGQVLPQVTGA